MSRRVILSVLPTTINKAVLLSLVYKSKFKAVLLSAVSTLMFMAVCGVLPAEAASQEFQAAMADFQAKRYSQALQGFQSIGRSNRSDILSHYYIALCYQNMNQVALATQEYQWVARYSKDPGLVAKAKAGAAQLSRYQSVRSQSIASSSSTGTGQKKNSPYSKGRLKVIEFYTTWCHVCREYEPQFEKAQSDYSSKCDFQRLNAEDGDNLNLVKKYKIAAYPTTVFADSSGKVVNIFSGSTSARHLGGMIDECMALLP